MLIKTIGSEDKRVSLTDLLEGKTKVVKGQKVPVTIKDYAKRRIWVLPAEMVSLITHANLKDESQTKKMPAGPASTNIMSFFDTYDAEGNSYRLRWAESAIPGTALKAAVYNPDYITINSSGWISVEDPEKNYFLEHNPHNGSIPATMRKGKEVQYMEYNATLNSIPHINRVKDLTFINNKIFGMSFEQLKAACDTAVKNGQAVNIPDLEIAEMEQMQSALIILANGAMDPMGWSAATLNLMDNVIMMAINQAKTNGKIEFGLTTREWKFTNTSLKTKLICKVETGVDSEKALLDFMLAQPEAKRDLLLSEISANMLAEPV